MYFCIYQVKFYERDINQVKAGEKKELVYSTVTGIKSDLSGTQQVPEILDNCPAQSDDGSDSSSETSDSEKKGKFVTSARPRDESPNSKRVTTNWFCLTNWITKN